MEEFLLVARNITQAQHMAAVLARAGVLRTPSALSESGCSHAVRLRAQTAAQALALLAAEKLTPQRVYVRTAEGYEEMGG